MTHTMLQRTIELTPSERKKLGQLLLGYGKLSEAVEKSGLHKNTLYLVNLSGRAKPETIAAIRKKLLSKTKSKQVA
jgi:hypothetical protein